jgi:hypothetical protein
LALTYDYIASIVIPGTKDKPRGNGAKPSTDGHTQNQDSRSSSPAFDSDEETNANAKAVNKGLSKCAAAGKPSNAQTLASGVDAAGKGKMSSQALSSVPEGKEGLQTEPAAPPKPANSGGFASLGIPKPEPMVTVPAAAKSQGNVVEHPTLFI